MLSETSISKDERTNAALAHGSIVLGIFSRGMLGVLLAFLIWVTQRGKSKFVARQAAQALVWQLCGIVASIGAFVAWGVVFAGSIFLPLLINSQHPEPMMLFTMIPAALLLVVPFALMFAWIACGVVAAWRVWHGGDYTYPIIGRWIK
jgi:uncharacterized Tic20 family protein